MPSTNVGRSGAIIAAGTLTSRVLGLVRTMVLLYAIGNTGIAANAFATAGRVPNSIYTLIAAGALTAVLVPQITRAALAKDSGAGYINKLVTLAIVGSAAVTVLAALFTPILISWLTHGWSEDRVDLTVVFAYWLLPQILFYTLYTVLGEVLNARSYFGPYAWAPVLNNVLNIAGLIAFVVIFGSDPNGQRGTGVWDALGIGLVAGSFTLGVAVQALVLFAFWRRAGLRYRPDFQFKGAGLTTMGKVAFWTFLSVLVTQGVGWYNTSVMNLAQNNEAGIAAAETAGLIFVLPHSIIVISLVTARFTRMSESVHQGDTAAFKGDLTASARQAGVFMMFFCATMLILAAPLTRLIMPSAAQPEILTAALVLAANLIGLVPFSLLFVFNRGFFALSDTRTPFVITAIQSVLTLAAAYFCSQIMTSAITTTLTALVSLLFAFQAVATYFVLQRKIGSLGGTDIVTALIQFGLAAVIAALPGFGLFVLFGGIAEGSFAIASFGSALLVCAVITCVMAACYFGALLAFRNAEAQGLWRKLRARFPGRS